MLVLLDKNPTTANVVEIVFSVEDKIRRLRIDTTQVQSEIIDSDGNTLDIQQWFHEHMVPMRDEHY